MSERTPNEVRALREAWLRGVAYNYNGSAAWPPHGVSITVCKRYVDKAAELFPLPMVTVPRVVEADGWQYRIIDGRLQVRSGHAPITDRDWIESHGILERTRVINDLLANPTTQQEAE